MKTMNVTSTVRLLAPDRALLEKHFLCLESDDRRLRFGALISDDGLRSYVARLDFERDGLFAVQDESLDVAAVVHIAVTGKSAELGLSVLREWRGSGLGNALLTRAVTFLRNRGVHEVFVHCLSENGAMMHLARKNGMRIVYSGGQSDARLAIDPPTANSFINEWLADQQAHTVQRLRRVVRITQLLTSATVPYAAWSHKPFKYSPSGK
jgi:ribosomal protein S18 acetylase RimI-like enzyme